jgi:hypothetical protein
LFFEESAMLALLFLGLDLRGCPHAFQLRVGDDDGVGFLALLGLLSDVAQLVLVNDGSCYNIAGFATCWLLVLVAYRVIVR